MLYFFSNKPYFNTAKVCEFCLLESLKIAHEVSTLDPRISTLRGVSVLGVRSCLYDSLRVEQPKSHGHLTHQSRTGGQSTWHVAKWIVDCHSTHRFLLELLVETPFVRTFSRSWQKDVQNRWFWASLCVPRVRDKSLEKRVATLEIPYMSRSRANVLTWFVEHENNINAESPDLGSAERQG